MALALPLIAWGTPVDFTAAPWGVTGSPALTPGQPDPLGGTAGVTVNDDDAGAYETIYRNFTVATDGAHTVVWAVQAGTAAITDFKWYDATLGATVAIWRLTWNAGVPATSVLAGAASVCPAVALGGGWYAILATVSGIVAANTQRLYCYPAGSSAVSATGSVTLFQQSMVLVDFPDQPVAWAENREGSARARAPSGAYDSWITGTDYRFRALCPWIPSAPRSAPAIVSGWSGLAPIPGVDCGVAAMLAAGRNATSLRWVPDRSVCTTYIDSELVAPFDPAPPDLGPDGTRRITLELRNITTPYPLYDG